MRNGTEIMEIGKNTWRKKRKKRKTLQEKGKKLRTEIFSNFFEFLFRKRPPENSTPLLSLKKPKKKT